MTLRAHLVLPLLLAVALPASASTLTDYNVVLVNDFNARVHVEGATFVGGNLTSGELSEFNHKNLTPAGYDGLRVGGTVSGKFKVMHGESVSYNASNGAQIECQGGGGGSTCITAGANHAAERAQLAAEMAALSLLYDSKTTNGVLSVNTNQVKLTYTGSDELAVFDVQASAVFFQNAGIELILGNATRAVINVHGNVTTYNTNLNGAWNHANTLWNFVGATSVNLEQTPWRGTILAPSAAVFNGGGIDGSLYAQSYSNSTLREIHGFRWTPDVPTASVPDGGSVTSVFGALLGAMFALRRRVG